MDRSRERIGFRRESCLLWSYEWLTLLQIHVDEYKLRIYQSLRQTVDEVPMTGREMRSDKTHRTHDMYLAPEAAALCGHRCGNNDHPGCLTTDQNVRLHSCEAGTDCKALKSPNVVWITPMITYSANGEEVLELGAGGGGGDLVQHELELEDEETTRELLQLCFRAVKDSSVKQETEKLISEAYRSPAQKMSLDSISAVFSNHELSLIDFARLLTDAAGKEPRERGGPHLDANAESKQILPRHIVWWQNSPFNQVLLTLSM